MEEIKQKNQPKSYFSEIPRKVEAKFPALIILILIILLLSYVALAIIFLLPIIRHW